MIALSPKVSEKNCIFVLCKMRKIDRETTQRILDAADIVEVVSDFVSLKRRGSNYIGLCPFHNERTPSFSVSKSRGICKCFSCGKGGSPVNFLIELEGMTYQEALRWLAKKYNIEIKEREVSDEERQAEAKRESLLAVNEFALKFFEDTMADTDEGRNVGLAYFRERGINDAMIKRFHLGYSPEKSDSFYISAHERGYTDENLIETGLCASNNRGLYDRFRGRVIYPVFSLSGRVVAFGGRTLKSDKSIAKYVNSPESVIYSKSRELYGLYQARQAITRHDKCILVEGYMDVISMHQSGVENVVASSGTSLTEQQITLIHRFTKNVTVIYDSDPAGIKASLRGIDMLLRQGLDIKVLLLPDGDDPDSFAQHHTSEEVEQYIKTHETDFIRFKSDILLKDAEDDPIRRADAVTNILRSVAVVPDPIKRQTYLDLCARMFRMDEKMLGRQIAKFIADNEEENYKEKQREQARRQREDLENNPPAPDPSAVSVESDEKSRTGNAEEKKVAYLKKFEQELIRYAVRYGLLHLCDAYDSDNQPVPMTVLDFIVSELEVDGIEFACDVHSRLWNRIIEISKVNWPEESERVKDATEGEIRKLYQQGLDEIRSEATDLNDIRKREAILNGKIDQLRKERSDEGARHFLEKLLCSDSDDAVRRIATDLSDDKYVLSKVHTKYTKIETEQDRLAELVPRAVYELKNAILTCKINSLQQRLKMSAQNGEDEVVVMQMINELMELNKVKSEFARYLGDRIITPTPLR